MKRTILTGILALAAGVAVLMAQQAPPKSGQAAPAAQSGQAAPPAAAPTGPRPKSPEEGAAVQALVAAQNKGDNDEIIRTAEDLLTRFADTQYKEIALTLEAAAYDMKSDATHEQVVWTRLIEVNPMNFQANLKLGGLIARQTGAKDLDRDDQLAKAEKYTNSALTILKTTPKPNPGLADAQWEQIKHESDAEGHYNLGMIEVTRALANKDADPAKYDKAIAELKIAADEYPEQTAYQARLAAVLLSAGKNADAVAMCDKILALPNLNEAIKSFATNLRAEAAKAAK